MSKFQISTGQVHLDTFPGGSWQSTIWKGRRWSCDVRPANQDIKFLTRNMTRMVKRNYIQKLIINMSDDVVRLQKVLDEIDPGFPHRNMNTYVGHSFVYWFQSVIYYSEIYSQEHCVKCSELFPWNCSRT